MKINNYFHITIMMFLASSLLMIAHNNAPQLLSAQFLWGPLFVISLFLSDSRLFLNKIVFTNLLFFILYSFILPNSVWYNMNEWYAYRQPLLFSQILYASLLYAKLYKDGNVVRWEYYAKVSMFFIVITCIMTIVATSMEPLIVRIAYSGQRDELIDGNTYSFYRRLGFASYGYVSALVTLLPILSFFVKNKENKRFARGVFVVILIVVYYTLIRAQIFANILVGSIFMILSFLGLKEIKKSILVTILILIAVLIVPKSVFSEVFRSASEYFDVESNVYYKLNDIAIFIENPEVEDSNTGAGGRMKRYPMLISAFVEAPLLGDASYPSRFSNEVGQGAHLFWMSRLALWGVLGFSGFLYLLFINFRMVYGIVPKTYRFYYLLSIASFVVLGFIKSVNILETLLVLFVVIPGLCFLHQHMQEIED